MNKFLPLTNPRKVIFDGEATDIVCRPYIYCHFPGVESQSQSNTQSQTVDTSGASKSATGSADAVQTGDNSIAVGSGGKYQEAGATDLGSSLSNNSGTISIGDTGDITQLAKDFAASTQNIVATSAGANLTSNNAFLQGLQELAMSQQTGGLTPVMKTFLWLAGGGLLLLAIIFRKRE